MRRSIDGTTLGTPYFCPLAHVSFPHSLLLPHLSGGAAVYLRHELLAPVGYPWLGKRLALRVGFAAFLCVLRRSLCASGTPVAENQPAGDLW